MPVYRHSFRLPDAKPPQPGWGVVSLLLHAVVVAALVPTVGRRVANQVAERFGDSSDVTSREYVLLLDVAPQPTVRSQPASGQPAVAGDSASGVSFVVAPRVVPIGIPPKHLTRHNPVLGSVPVIGSSYGTGHLWVGPLEGRLGVIGASPDPATHAARVDSAVQAKILEFLAAMPPDSFATPVAPSWVTEINGKKWGVDGKYVYLGDLKLPAPILALLGLLPLPQGNYEQAQQARELQRVREEIIRAARQAETNADFRRYVKAIRARKDAEREAQRLAEAEREAKQPVKRDTIP
jgi:hypothetical protein